MAIFNYINPMYLILILQLIYYTGRQRLIAGIYSMSIFSTLWLLLVLLSTPLLVLKYPVEISNLIIYQTILVIVALFLTYLKPIREYLKYNLEIYWYNSILALSSGCILATALQYYVFYIQSDSLLTFNDLPFIALPIAFLFSIIGYCSIPIAFYHSLLQKHRMTALYLAPLFMALNDELYDFEQQLLLLKNDHSSKFNTTFIEKLDKQIAASKLPIFSDSIEVSIALYPYLENKIASNTWIEAQLLNISTKDLTILLHLLCNYLSEYSPQLMLGIQLTPLTNGELIIKIQNNIMNSRHLDTFIKRQKLCIPLGYAQNHQITRMSIRHLLYMNKLHIT